MHCFIIITPINNNYGNTFKLEVCLGFYGVLFHFHQSYRYIAIYKSEVCSVSNGALFIIINPIDIWQYIHV